MAKSGSVTGNGGNAEIEAAALGDLTPSLTLGQIAANSLAGSSLKEQILIDLAARTVKVWTGAGAIDADPTSDDVYGAFTLDDDTKKVAPWTAAAVGASGVPGLLALANTAVKPSRSLASMISAAEDFLTANPPADGVDIVIDQNTEQLIFIKHGVVNSVVAPLEIFTQVLQQSDGTVQNAFE